MISYTLPKTKFSHYRDSARKRMHGFELTLEQFITFWQKPCSYCGEEIKTIGLDRVDNSKGYVMGNVVSCCTPCNRAKWTRSVSDFVDMCRRVVRLHGGLK
jgi:uncharacterized protein with PIN domain